MLWQPRSFGRIFSYFFHVRHLSVDAEAGHHVENNRHCIDCACRSDLWFVRIRAGWMAVLIPCLYLLYKVRLSGIKNKIGKNALCAALAALCIIVAVAFYQYKKASADVRLLIGTVGVEMFAEAPLCGHGIGSFAKEYMEYQAGYFERYPDSVYASLSDNNTQAFNELLTVLCEQGVIGGMLVLFLLGIAFCGKKGRLEYVVYCFHSVSFPVFLIREIFFL